MSSGVGVSNQVLQTYEDMKLGRKYAYIVFAIQNSTEIIVEKTMTTEEASKLSTPEVYESFKSSIPKDEARYGVFDLEYDLGQNGVRSKLIFIVWNPSEGKIRSKMIYASSKKALRDRNYVLIVGLDGIHQEVQCNDLDELAFESVFEVVAPKGATFKTAKEE
ncbi:cofilin [Boothiomyces macroporosus]|uniref:Cofilin n=1 Tax=Boothiomyces macroporosus TaxID=261099 RepID=A0AAD5UMU7_9FUNG|nr:cofilin [Boothiomyces macroporosus]